jgi:hypothetical protein
MRSTMRLRIVAILGTALLVAACQAGATPGATPSPTASPGITHTTGAADLVVRIENGGGFVGPTYQLRQLPWLSIFGDGRVMVPGPQIEIYPGPALPNVVTFRISEEGLQKVLEEALADGLLGADAQYQYPGIADAGTTTFTVVAGGKRHIVSAYALAEGGAMDSQLDPETLRARTALLKFQERALDLRSWLGAAVIEPESAYRFEALRIFVTAAQPADQGITPGYADWPLATPLASFGDPMVGNLGDMRCAAVSGDDLAKLLPAIQNSNELTLWHSGGKEYQLVLRPLLPDESGCPAST